MTDVSKQNKMKHLIKSFLALLLVAGMGLSVASCSKDNEDTSNTEETTDGYTFVKTVSGHTGNSVVSTSAYLKIYKKGGNYYATLGSNSEYHLCARNSSYSSSYTGSDPKKKYRYYVKPYTITYYFDI